MFLMQEIPGVLKIKNVSGGPYDIEELAGHTIADQEEIDICDSNLAVYYEGYKSALRLVEETTTAKLYQDIQSGDIEVTEKTPPVRI